MNVSGIFKIQKSKTKQGKEAYFTKISKKNADGTTEQTILPVRFTKNIGTMNKVMFDEENNQQCYFNIEKAWLSFYTKQNNQTIIELVVHEMLPASSWQIDKQENKESK